MNSINLCDEFLEEQSDKWFKIIIDNPDKKWNFSYLSTNKNVTWKIIKKYNRIVK